MSVDVAWFPDYGHFMAGIFCPLIESTASLLQIHESEKGVEKGPFMSFKVIYMTNLKEPKTLRKVPGDRW